MGLRFKKSINILPGLRLNLSKNGVSTTIGKSGSCVNISKNGVKGTIGIPGSGLSYTETISTKSNYKPNTGLFVVLVIIFVIIVSVI
jgi:hypothetical protein